GLIGAYPASAALIIGPFAGLLGGVAQFAAAMWAFRARDGLGTGMLGVWGSFWIGYGILQLLFATGTLVAPGAVSVGLGVVFGTLAAITYVGAIAAARVNLALCATLFLLASGAAVGSAANATGDPTVTVAAGAVFMAAAAAGWYTASGLLLRSVYRRSILPMGLRKRPGDLTTARGEPGIF
ncbi:MAG TPA: GPR1/FUN34/YaaH family transporter, partial [Anaerolineae bacterium]|nr:GPR1/FUN34/YaaH family transporter [Anaerolineae bacterium]